MKKILLIISILIFSVAGFAQNPGDFSSGWNNNSTDINKQVELKIYPNPCTNQKITIETSNEELSEIRITNITGKVVVLKRYELPINKVDLILQNAPNGIYLVQIKTSSEKVVTKKLVVSGS